MSLNTNDVQIYSRQGPDWVVTETLSEVCIYTFDSMEHVHPKRPYAAR